MRHAASVAVRLAEAGARPPLARRRGLGVLDEDAVSVDREHEPAERPLNRPGADAQEAVAGGLGPLDERIQAANLELKLRGADVLYSPAKRFGLHALR